MLKRRKKRGQSGPLTYILLVFIVVAINMPVFQMVMVGLKRRDEAMISTRFFPERPQFVNFVNILRDTNFGLYLTNSVMVAVLTTICCICIALFAGYAISRFRGKIFSGYLIALLLLQIFPIMLLLIPLFVIFSGLGLVDNLGALVLAYTTLNVPFSIWMIKGFMDTIPFDLEEAAMIDGASQFQALLRVIFPITLPGVTAVGIFTFINSWSEYTLASILVRSTENLTITVGLQEFAQQFYTDWASKMTAATIGTIPMLIFLIFAQKYLIRGMSAGSVKG